MRQPLDYLRTRHLVNEMVKSGYDQDFTMHLCLSGEDIDDCFFICNACNSVFDVHLKKSNSELTATVAKPLVVHGLMDKDGGSNPGGSTNPPSGEDGEDGFSR